MSIKPIAVVIPADKFRDEELFEPLDVWQAAGIPFVLASSRTGKITGDLGGESQATALIDDLQPEDYSAIVVIGGSGTVGHLWEHAGLQSRLKAFAAAQKLTSAICAGAVALARSGLLQGREATTYPLPLMTEALQAAGVPYCAAGLVDHGDIITASGPAEATAFAKAVAAAVARSV